MIYSGSRDGAIKVWGVTDNKKLRSLTAINGHSVNFKIPTLF